MTCRLCGDSGKQGSIGYWIYCSCNNGIEKSIEDALCTDSVEGEKE